ncbi:hypothetical protein GA0061096_3222 [Fictibacillus enclensis]|uniref:Uncharacterized protein n=1 Tax=Fictibacillus enclensis TaxID=1017270 RepID=A0A0V8J6R2_9BACL|nr:hypothetical protein [Fictibacillus enclensis]KSU82783.1 hypothetical protein AS030_15265 [Fictibacillus enclensis]SCC22582.1 hypothetical protein GA0061096_3222 [Fictibacillus enclensis]
MSTKDDQNCQVGIHTAGNDAGFNIVTGLNTIFEDLTNNHNKTLIDITNLSPVTLTITIRTRDCHRNITEMLGSGLRRVFQVEDFESLTINSPDESTVNVIVQKTFCICCGEEKEESSSSSFSHRKHQKKEALNAIVATHRAPQKMPMRPCRLNSRFERQ